MLVTEKVFGMHELEDRDLTQVKNDLYTNFALKLGQELLETNHHKEGVQNYAYFFAEYCKKITYNTKNITYEEEAYDLREFCGNYFELKPEVRCTAGSNEITKEILYYTAPTEEEFYKKYEAANTNPSTDAYSNILKLANYDSFFGRGEFPFVTITIIRIGNQDYYFGKIHR